MRFTRWMAGYYRLTAEVDFAGIRRQRDGWHVEIRDITTGDLHRYGGIWPTLREAKAEAGYILGHRGHRHVPKEEV